jgi:hypothetical protein
MDEGFVRSQVSESTSGVLPLFIGSLTDPGGTPGMQRGNSS